MILSRRLAIVSLGVSCQTAFQIEAHASFIGQRLGCEMEKRATPFDWLYVPVAGAAAMVRDECYFPSKPFDLIANHHPADLGKPDAPTPSSGWRKPYWPKYGATFWHSKFDDPATFLSKAQHAADNLKRICQADRRVFIVSNTQNNIARSMREAGREPMDTGFTMRSLYDLRDALNEQFWPCETVAVAQGAVASTNSGQRAGLKMVRFAADRSTWEGDGKQWRKLFEEIVR